MFRTHHRHQLCRQHDIRFKTVAYSFASRDEAMLWVLDNQDARRNSHTIDKIESQQKREEITRRLAKENQRQSKGRGKKVAQDCATLKPIKTSKVCAAAAGVGER